jgi:CDP-ribitol ribitolphosphotransferase
VFISRQSDQVPLDFLLLAQEITSRDSRVNIVYLTRRLRKNLWGYVRYYFTIHRQIFHLATSRVCVLDSYCIPVSILTHKPELFIVQLWHSIGKIKKSGHQTVAQRVPRNWLDVENIPHVIDKMSMHVGYDAIVAGAEFFNPFYQETFQVGAEKIVNYGLPRIDYLVNNHQDLRTRVLRDHPSWVGRKVVVYAPTFKPYDDGGPHAVIDRFLGTDVVVIVAIHPNQVPRILVEEKDNIYPCDPGDVIDLLAVADYLVTDYSALSLEAAIISTRVLFFLHDHPRYLQSTGLNLDPLDAMATNCLADVDDLYDVIMSDTYDDEAFEEFRDRYLPSDLGSSTPSIVDMLEQHWG